MKRRYHSTGTRAPCTYGSNVPKHCASDGPKFCDNMQFWNGAHVIADSHCPGAQQHYVVSYGFWGTGGDGKSECFPWDATSAYYPYDSRGVSNGVNWGIRPSTSHGGTNGGIHIKTTCYVNGVKVGDATHRPTEHVINSPIIINGITITPPKYVTGSPTSDTPTTPKTASDEHPYSTGYPSSDVHPSSDETPVFRGHYSPYDNLKHGSHRYDVTPQRMQEQGMKVIIHKHGSPYSHDKIQAAKELMEKTIQVYESNFGKFVARDVPREISIHTFDDVGGYLSSVRGANPQITARTSGYIEPATGTMWISPLGESFTKKFGALPHEMGHLLFQCATGGFFAYANDSNLQSAIKTLNDGFSEFISAQVYETGAAGLHNVADSTIRYFETHRGYRGKVLTEMGNNLAKYQCGPIDCNTLQYDAGHALVQFLVDKSPGTLQNMFKQAAKLSTDVQYVRHEETTRNAKEILQGINRHGMGEVASWLKTHLSPHPVHKLHWGAHHSSNNGDVEQSHGDNSYSSHPLWRKPVLPHVVQNNGYNSDKSQDKSDVQKPVVRFVKSSKHAPKSELTYAKNDSSFVVDGGRAVEVRSIVVNCDDADQNDGCTRSVSMSKPVVSDVKVSSSQGAETQSVAQVASNVKAPQSHGVATHSAEPRGHAPAKAVQEHHTPVEGSSRDAIRDLRTAHDGNTHHLNNVETQDFETERAMFIEPIPSIQRVKHGIAYDVTPQSLLSYGMKVTIYKQGSPLSQDLIESAKDLLERTMQVYTNHFGKFVPRAIPQEIGIMMFDHDHEYLSSIKSLFPTRGDNTSGLTSASDGLVWVLPSVVRSAGEKNFGTMVHEFSHILYRSATGGFLDHNNSLNAYHQAKVLGEGFCEFINGKVHNNDFGNNAKAADLYLKGQYQDAPVLSHMGTDIEQGKCGTRGCSVVKHQTGHALVKFLEDTSPGLLKDVFKTAADNSAKYAGTGRMYDAAKFLQPINEYSIADVASWTSKSQATSQPQASGLPSGYQGQDSHPDAQQDTHDTSSEGRAARRVSRDVAGDQSHAVGDVPVTAAAARYPGSTSQVTEQAASGVSGVNYANKSSGQPAHDSSNVADVANTSSVAGEVAYVMPALMQTGDSSVQPVAAPETPAEVVASSYVRKSFADVEAQFTVSTDIDAKLLDRCNIKLVVHSTAPLSPRAAARIKKTMVKTLKAYQKEFGELPKSDTVRKIDISLFNNGTELKDALRDIGEPNWDSAAGINWSSLGKIYVSKLGKVKIENLSHELTHQLMHYSTGRAFDKIPGMAILREGVADYIQYLVEHSNKNGMTIEFSAVINGVRKIFDENPELKNATSLEKVYEVIEKNAEKSEYGGLKYSFGKVFVYYLQKAHPEALKTLFAEGSDKSAKGEYYDQLASIVNNIPGSFGEWLSENTVEKHISKHEMLTVSEGDCLGFRDTIANSTVVRADVYAANLEDSNHGHVGKLSPVAHFLQNGVVRAYNPYSGDGVTLGKEFSYLKLVSTADGPRYAYCDVNGTEFIAALNGTTADQIAKIFSKYDPHFSVIREAVASMDRAFFASWDERDTAARSAVISAISNVKSILSNAARNMQSGELQKLIADLVQQDPNISGITETVSNLKAAYSKFVSAETQTLLQSPEHSTLGQAAMLSRILKSIVFVDPETMISTNEGTFDKIAQETQGKILQVVGLGKADLSGASVLLDGQKLGELPSNAEGFVKHTDAAGKAVATFTVMDVLKAVYTSYSGSPLVIVTKDAQGNKVANFWHSTKSGTLNDQEMEVEVNQFLDLSAKGIKARESFPMSKGIKIAIYEEDPEIDGNTPLIVPGSKLDDRGTARESDDLYSAKLKVGDSVLIKKMSSLQFYMTEERTDEHGNKIEQPDFCIRDVAADRVIQFPESITHLKLVRTEKGTVRLVPCTKDGDTNPEGMPTNMERYSYIDPIFVYDRKSSEWTATNSKFSLVDFSGYSSGTLFKLSQDSNDPAIKRDANGNILRVNNQSYNVSVNIDGPNGERVGRLASTTAFFQNNVFLAMDQSYSQSDFVSSQYMQEAEVQDTAVSDVKRVALSGEKDLGTDRGFSEYYSQYQRTQEDTPDLRTEIRKLASSKQDEASSTLDTPGTDRVARNQNTSASTHEASESERSMLTKTFIYMVEESNTGSDGTRVCFNVFDGNTGTYMQFPHEITHVKVVTHAGQKYLVPCTADGSESPEGMPSQEKVYINPLFAHTAVSRDSTAGGDKTQLKLLNLDSYADGTLFSIRVGGQLSYSAMGYEDKAGDQIRVPHLYDENGVEVAILSTYGRSIRGTVIIEEDSSPSIPTAIQSGLIRGLVSTEMHNAGNTDDTIDTTHLVAKNAERSAHDYMSQMQHLPSGGANNVDHITGGQRYGAPVSDVHHSSKEHDDYDGNHTGGNNHQYGYSDSDLSML